MNIDLLTLRPCHLQPKILVYSFSALTMKATVNKSGQLLFRFPITHMNILACQTQNVKIHEKAPSGCYCFGKIFKRRKITASREADELIGDQGQEVTLKEDPQLQLLFLLPEDLWLCSAASVCGVPPGLKEFLNLLAGKCKYKLSINTTYFCILVGLDVVYILMPLLHFLYYLL